jgi:hypothetical protein
VGSLLPLARYLDPRPRDVARALPYPDSVNIPADELTQRIAELRSKEHAVFVVGRDASASEAIRILAASGRKWVSVELATADEFVRSRLWRPSSWLEECLPEIAPGDALDLGCGGGRDAVYLAASGWNVHAVDHLPDCATRGKLFASHYLEDKVASRIQWETADLRSPDWSPGKSVSLLTAMRFYDRNLMAKLVGWLSPGGSILVEAFTSKRREDIGRPSSPDRVTTYEELRRVFRDLEILRLEESEGGHTVCLWARQRD